MTILVTGGGGGIGRAVVELALERGHEVIAHDLDDAALSGLQGADIVAGRSSILEAP